MTTLVEIAEKKRMYDAADWIKAILYSRILTGAEAEPERKAQLDEPERKAQLDEPERKAQLDEPERKAQLG